MLPYLESNFFFAEPQIHQDCFFFSICPDVYHRFLPDPEPMERMSREVEVPNFHHLLT